MPPKIRQLKAQLRSAGFSSQSGKGSHTVWTHPLVPEATVTLSGKDGADADKYQLKDVRDALRKLREVQQ